MRYVALTRAKTHQVLQDATAKAVVEELSPDDWKALGAWTGGGQRQAPVPELGGTIAGLENRHPWVESHSGLWRRAIRDDVEVPTVWDGPWVARDDEGPGVELVAPEPLPAGPAFGDLVHDLLEAADYRGWSAQASPELQKATAELVENHCQRHRGDFRGRDLSKPLGTWLAQAMNRPLPLGPSTTPVSFSQLTPQDTRRELEFHLPLAIEGSRDFDWGERRFTVHGGFLTGRIDLLFRWEGRLYLADWKTNRLTPGQEPSELMTGAGYDLQAQWYWEALRRLCRVQRESLIPGGVLFVFLRGDGTLPQGVFLAPEDLNRITTLTSFFGEAAHA